VYWATTCRKPADYHVEKAADDETEEEAGFLEEQRRQHSVSVQEGFLGNTRIRIWIVTREGVIPSLVLGG